MADCSVELWALPEPSLALAMADCSVELWALPEPSLALCSLTEPGLGRGQLHVPRVLQLLRHLHPPLAPEP